MTSGRLLEADVEDVHVVRFEGEIRYPLSPVVERFFSRLFERDERPAIVLDLSDAGQIDSTNLGLFAKVAMRCQAAGAPRVAIVSPREELRRVLVSMGFDEVFDIVRSPPPGAALVDAEPVASSTGGDATPAELGATMLAAHRALMALNDANRAQFSDVVDALERETGTSS